MSTLNTQATYFRSTVSKLVMAFTFASVIGGISLGPALGQENQGRQRQQRPEQRAGVSQARERQDVRRWHGPARRDVQRGNWHDWRDDRRWRGHPLYDNRPPLYLPPPIVYAPHRPPGISLFFPLPIR